LEKRNRWILAGYKLIAEQGMQALNAEHLASHVGSSKSSFYHYFGKLDTFKGEQLEYHLKRAKVLSSEIKTCETLLPDVLNIFLEHKESILFHKQLCFYRENPQFKKSFTKAYEQVEKQILIKLNAHLGIVEQPIFAKSLFSLISDSFLMRITKQNFTYAWIKNFVDEMLYLVVQMKSIQR
jgi:AcrR family transcriptional regulator